MNEFIGQTTFRTFVKASVITVFVLLAITFVIFQARYLIIGPQIVIIDAPEGPQNERQVFIAGKAENISHLWLNGRQIYTDIQGNFREGVVLENGYSIITLRAEDRYGRVSEVSRGIVYEPMTFIK